MVDQMGDFRPIIALFGAVILGILVICLKTEWEKRKIRKETQEQVQLIRFYQRDRCYADKVIYEDENLDGCAESAIRITNQEWQDRNDGDNEQVAQAW